MRLLKSHGFNFTSHRIVYSHFYSISIAFWKSNTYKDSNTQALKPLDHRTLIKKGLNREHKDHKVIPIK